MLTTIMKILEKRNLIAMNWRISGRFKHFPPLLVGMAAIMVLICRRIILLVFNLVTGLSFPLPLAVQPMKAIAAVARLGRFDRSQFWLRSYR